MTRIVFVDDEQRVLDGLRRLLRPMRRQWEMEFIDDPQEALDRIDDEPFDIVVTDMRMPHLDGLAVLERVKEKHPDMVRFVLSGHTDLESSLRMTGLAHQFLAKPCDPEHLKLVVTRASLLREKLRSESLLKLVSGISALPSRPEVVAELMTLVEPPNSALSEIGAVIARDPGMTAKVLQLVNSSFFGLRRRVTDPVQAVSFVGLDNLVALVLGDHLFTELDAVSEAGVDVAAMHDLTTAVAVGARAIAAAEGLDREIHPEYFLAGMLHDAGQLVMAANFPDRYRNVLASEGPPLDAERAEFGATHEDVGAYLIGLWGLPDTVVEAAAFHHDPSPTPASGLTPVTAVHVARAAVTGDESALDWDYLRGIGVEDRVSDWMEVAARAASSDEGEEAA